VKTVTAMCFVLIILLALMIVGCTPSAHENTHHTQNVPISLAPNPTPQYAIVPISGEYADDTTFTNVGFILDYQIVNGIAVATMTYVYPYCYVANIGDVTETAEPVYAQASTSMSVQTDGTTELYGYFAPAPSGKGNPPVSGYYDMVGQFANDTFTLASSSFNPSNHIGPVTFTFYDYLQGDALSHLEKTYSKSSLCTYSQ